MPKAIRFNQLGGPEVLHIEDLPDRQPGPGEALLKVEAVGLNRAESMYYHGTYMQKVEPPSGIGYEALAKVIAVGSEVDPTLIGKLFGTIPGFSMRQYPVLAEEAVVPASVLAAVPDSFSADQGAAVWMQYCTAYGALVPFGKVAAGDFAIITAASSSVGIAAIQIVKAKGGISIATTRTSAKKEKLIALGADHVIVTEEEDLVARVQPITGGKGACIVFDPVGGDYINTLAQATANGGTIFLYGMLSGKPTPFPMAAFARRIGMFGYTFNELRGTPEWETMKKYIYDGLANGSFKPEIARTFPFDQTVEAYRYLESNEQIGKVVITLQPWLGTPPPAKAEELSFYANRIGLRPVLISSRVFADLLDMSSVDEQANLYFERPPPWKKYAQAILLEARIPPGHMGVYRDFIA